MISFEEMSFAVPAPSSTLPMPGRNLQVDGWNDGVVGVAGLNVVALLKIYIYIHYSVSSINLIFVFVDIYIYITLLRYFYPFDSSPNLCNFLS